MGPILPAPTLVPMRSTLTPTQAQKVTRQLGQVTEVRKYRSSENNKCGNHPRNWSNSTGQGGAAERPPQRVEIVLPASTESLRDVS